MLNVLRVPVGQSYCFTGTELCFHNMKKFWRRMVTVSRVYLMSLKFSLKNGNFYSMCILPH